MGLLQDFINWNKRIFFTDEGNEPAIAWAYRNDGKGNKDFFIDIFGSKVVHRTRVDEIEDEMMPELGFDGKDKIEFHKRED